MVLHEVVRDRGPLVIRIHHDADRAASRRSRDGVTRSGTDERHLPGEIDAVVVVVARRRPKVNELSFERATRRVDHHTGRDLVEVDQEAFPRRRLRQPCRPQGPRRRRRPLVRLRLAVRRVLVDHRADTSGGEPPQDHVDRVVVAGRAGDAMVPRDLRRGFENPHSRNGLAESGNGIVMSHGVLRSASLFEARRANSVDLG